MKKRLQLRHILPAVLFSGIFCFLLRMWLFAVGIDQKGLLQTNLFANSLSFIITGAVLLLLLYFLRSIPKKSNATISPANPKLAALGCVVAAAGILLSVLPGF